MSELTHFRCSSAQCGGHYIIPLKLVVRREFAVAVGRCPHCKRKSKRMLPLQQQDRWLPLARDLFLSCGYCGAPNLDNWDIVGSGYSLRSFQMNRNVKILFHCRQCGRKNVKAIDEWLWGKMESLQADLPTAKPSTKTPPPAPAKQTPPFCRHCGAELLQGSIFCGECGARL